MKRHIRFAAFLLAVLLLLPAAGTLAQGTRLTVSGGGEEESGGEDSTQNTDSAEPTPADTEKTSTQVPIAAGEKLIALTFDDGPNSANTPKLLDMLKKYGVHATFFVLGCNVGGNEKLLRRMADEGHEIGNHSYDHSKFTALSDDAIISQLARTNKLIYNACGVTITLARPPYGARNTRVLKRFGALGLACVLWSIDPEDWNTANAKAVRDHVVKRAKAGSIILMHDLRASSVAAAESIIRTLTEQGYRFVTVSELFAGEFKAGAAYRHN